MYEDANRSAVITNTINDTFDLSHLTCEQRVKNRQGPGTRQKPGGHGYSLQLPALLLYHQAHFTVTPVEKPFISPPVAR